MSVFVIFILLSASACGRLSKPAGDTKNNQKNTFDNLVVANITIFGNNCELKADNNLLKGTMINISGAPVSTDELEVYLYAAERDYVQCFGEGILEYNYAIDKTIRDLLKEKILEYVIMVKLISETANCENVYLTTDELLTVDARVNAFVKKTEDPASSVTLNKEAIRKVYSDGFLAKKYYDGFKGNEEEFFSYVRMQSEKKEIFLNTSEWESL